MTSRKCSSAILAALLASSVMGGQGFSQEIAPVKPKPRTILNEQPSEQTAVQIRSTVVNGVRTITVVEDQEKVEITDKAGKEITVKHTKMVAGKSETTEYKADNLATLKVKSPVAASLYEKYAGAPRPLGGGARPFPAPPPAPPNGRIPIQAQFFLNDDPEFIRPGPRRIRVELKDRRIEIHDGAGPSIRINIIKHTDDQDQVEEVVSENLVQLKESHPDLGRLYEKYTGIKVH